MFVVTPSTVWNPAALETRRVPKKMLGRIAILPRRGAGRATRLRLLVENQLFRFSAALSPFVLAMLVWPDSALPISQAPLAMLLVVGAVEMRVLRVSKEARAGICSEDEAARTLDALRFRATRVLTRIAARRGARDERLHLVIEQSELARVPPLTLVSVQRAGPGAALLDLDADERAMIASELFADGLDERALHRANLREDMFLRDIALEAQGVSAHARLAALIDQAAAAPA